jgi:hypothetical protein
MKRYYACLLSAGLLLSSVAIGAIAQVKNDSGVKDPGEKLEQLGSRQPDAKMAADVRESVAGLINEALTAGRFPDLVGAYGQAGPGTHRRDAAGEL